MSTPQIQHWQSDTGANIFFVQAPELPIVDLQIIFDAGSARDDGHAGLAKLTSSLLAEGAAGLSADQINQAFDDLGALYGSDTGYDFSLLSLRSLADAKVLTRSLQNLVYVLTEPDFPESAFIRQKQRTLVQIRNKQQSPSALAKDALYAEIFQYHPYALPNVGTEASVEKLQLGEVVDFYRRFYVARNATVAIVGDLSPARARRIAEKLLKNLPPGKKPKPLPAVPLVAQAKTVYLHHPSTQTHILLGGQGVKRGDPDYFPLYVGNHVLGGSGMVSRLFSEIREQRGLSYSVHSYFLPMRKTGPFTASLQTRADQAEAALALLRQNLETYIEQGPTEAELAAAKKNIIGGFPLRLDSNKKIISYIGMIGFYKLPLDYLETFASKINAVTTRSIREAFKRRLLPDKFITIIVGPVSAKPQTDSGEPS